MANIRFCWNNLYTADATVLAASSELSAMPVEMTKSTDRNNVWQSEADTIAQTIDIDLGSALEVSAVCVANASVLGAGVIELYELGDGGSPGAATLVATLAAEDAHTRASAAFFAAQTHRHWRLTFTNPSVVLGSAALGYAFLGAYDEPEFNVIVPFENSRTDPSAVSSSIDGQKHYSTRTKFQAGVWKWDAVRQAQLEQLQAMFNQIGVSTPLFMVLDGAISWTCWFARVGQFSWVTEPGGAIGRYGPQLPWEEVR
jgi:hypothetical protein